MLSSSLVYDTVLKFMGMHIAGRINATKEDLVLNDETIFNVLALVCSNYGKGASPPPHAPSRLASLIACAALAPQ